MKKIFLFAQKLIDTHTHHIHTNAYARHNLKRKHEKRCVHFTIFSLVNQIFSQYWNSEMYANGTGD